MACKIIIILVLLIFATNAAPKVLNDYQRLNGRYSWLNKRLYNHIRISSAEFRVPAELICAVIQHESRGRNIRSRMNHDGTRDYGYMQVNSVHGRASDLYNYKYNIKFGTWYLSKCLKKSRGNIRNACRYYNAGINSSKRKYKNWKYIDRIYADYKILRRNR